MVNKAPKMTAITNAAAVSVLSVDFTASDGGIIIADNMDQPIYAWSVLDTEGPMTTISAGGTYFESWRLNPESGGSISIKLLTLPNKNNVLQYEYSLVGSMICWDLSCINIDPDSPSTHVGFSVTSDNPQCEAVVCVPGDANCADAYLYPDGS